MYSFLLKDPLAESQVNPREYGNASGWPVERVLPATVIVSAVTRSARDFQVLNIVPEKSALRAVNTAANQIGASSATEAKCQAVTPGEETLVAITCKFP